MCTINVITNKHQGILNKSYSNTCVSNKVKTPINSETVKKFNTIIYG